MRINVVNRGRRLETISVGDILIFNNREEEVFLIDNAEGTLYTEISKGPVRENFAVYGPTNRISKICPRRTGLVLIPSCYSRGLV